ncbi:MAG: ATP-binding protein [bacterium]
MTVEFLRKFTPFEPEIAAVVEVIANCLDAKSSEIRIILDKKECVLSFIDNGLGMDKKQFQEYHDFASSTKERGSGIGFAGQGAKLALNFSDEVVTETWSSSYRGYSKWWVSVNDAPYKIYDGELPTISDPGTKVSFYMKKAKVPFYTDDKIINALIEHYYPLVDHKMKELYTAIYDKGLNIYFNGREIIREPLLQDLIDKKKDIVITVHNKPKAIGFFSLIKKDENFSPGIMVCTYGKVIERTFFKKEPREKNKITGWIEAPYLIEAVTTDKCRFQKGNRIWGSFFRKTQSEFSSWLEEHGLIEKHSIKGQVHINIEKEINDILKNLPELSLFGRDVLKDVLVKDLTGEPQAEERYQDILVKTGKKAITKNSSTRQGEQVKWGAEPVKPKPRIIRGGIKIAEDDKPEIEKESWFDGVEIVTLNKSHPAYNKALKQETLNYHILKSIILALIEYVIEKETESSPQRVLDIQQRFFRLWGERE